VDRVELAVTAVFTALVCAATVMLQVSIPETKGYFNVGEVMVYTTAIVFGPRIGMMAGGLGSALADVVSGYILYAPATLVIKGCEGLIVGLLSQRLEPLLGRRRVYHAVVSGFAVGALIWLTGSLLYSGAGEVTLLSSTHRVFFSQLTWLAIGCAASAAVALLGVLIATPMGTYLLSTTAGGAVMVLGYFLYESAIMGVPAALVEVPFNVGQVAIGASASIPLASALKVLASRTLKPVSARSRGSKTPA